MPFSNENSMEMFRFGLPSILNRFPIRYYMKTIAYENNIAFSYEDISIPFSYEKGRGNVQF